MSNVEAEANETPGERIEVSFRQEWIDVPSPAAPAAVMKLDGGVYVREEYSPSPIVHGVFIVVASKAGTRASDVKAIHGELLALMEDLRLVWYFSGGYWIRTPAESNFESVRDRLFEAEHGHPPFSASFLHTCNVIGPYRQMPLRDAISLLRGLGKLNADAPDEHKSALWTCLEAFHAATVAAGPTERFMRAFPALDLLASTHYGEPQLDPGAKSILRHIHGLLKKGRSQLGERAVEVLRGGLKVAALRDKFEAFVKDRLPQEAQALTDSFRKYNQLRNDVFHKARFGAIDSDAAEATRQLLERCLQAELGLILEKARVGGDTL
jgi:hypothetical protein